MKKLFILIGLIGFLTCSAQDFSWGVRSHGKNDTTAYDRHPNENWLGCYVTCEITIWNVEDITGQFTVGGFDNLVTIKTGKQNYSKYTVTSSGLDIDPIVADTSYVTGTQFKKNADSTRYNIKFSINKFANKSPAFTFTGGTTDSLEYYILFNAVKP
jgi:hypothetical protein